MNKKLIIGIIIVFIFFMLWNKSSENMINNKLNCKWTNQDGNTFNKTSPPCTPCNICQQSEKITYRNDNCKSEEINMGTKYVESKSCSF